jgi:WD40-like Beta Propeller Repeat
MSHNEGCKPPLVRHCLTALLVLASACGGGPTGTDAPGGLSVVMTTDGVSVDSDGYTVTVQKSEGYQTIPVAVDTVGINGTLDLPNLDVGLYAVTVTDVRFTCTVTDTDPPLVDLIWLYATVRAAHTTVARFHFTCRPPPTGRLVFIGTGGLSTINADGSGLTVLSPDSLFDGEPAWSPDGARIAWVHGDDIAVTNADGSGTVNLTNGVGRNASPSWSPDGSRLAFTSTRESELPQLFTMRADGSDVTRLTEGSALYPAWSPAGDRIAFSGDSGGVGGLFQIRPDGSGLARLTTAILYDYSPAWSPDGSRIAFHRIWGRNRDGDIFLMNADGSDITMLTHYTGVAPAWSPDGSKIVYRKDPGDLYFIAVDGTQEGRFIHGWDPDWTR